MNFQISALGAEQFSKWFELEDTELAARDAIRMIVKEKPGSPCRISLADAEVGETVILLNYEHLPVSSPYRARHAIFVRPNVETLKPGVNELPAALTCRPVAVRAFDKNGMMLDADIAEGEPDLSAAISNLLEIEAAEYLHLHYAKPGCYAARVDRVK